MLYGPDKGRRGKYCSSHTAGAGSGRVQERRREGSSTSETGSHQMVDGSRIFRLCLHSQVKEEEQERRHGGGSSSRSDSGCCNNAEFTEGLYSRGEESDRDEPDK